MNLSKLALCELGCVLLAIMIAYAFYVAWLDVPILHDAAGYVRAAEDIRENGLFSQWELSDIRTYGWPLLLSWLIRLSNWVGAPLRAVAFWFELLLHLVACYVFRSAIRSTATPPALATLLSVSLLLNPLILIFTTYLLTESTSFSLLILLLASSVYLIAATGKRSLYLAVALGSVVLGASIMIRPANLCMVPVYWAVVGVALWRSRPGLRKGLSFVLLALFHTFLPMLPQWLNNVRFYQRATPLLAHDFSHLGVFLGIRLIKYATSYIPGVNAQVMYLNPFLSNEPLNPLAPFAWYVSHPAKGLATLGLHIFNLLDQDQPFPYTTALLPAYYPFVAQANMLVVSFGVIGLVLAGRYVYLRKREAISLYWLAVGTLFCQLGMQAFFSVEARYGVPALMVLYMFAVWVLAFEWPRANVRKRSVMLALAGAATVAAWQLSGWVRLQSPSIRTALENRGGLQEARQILKSLDSGRRFVSGELANWSVRDGGVGTDGEAILCAVGPAPYSIFYHPVTLEESADYVVEFEARAAAGVTSELSVDLYGGTAYDKAEQNSVFTTFSNRYQRFKAEWNSGADAPPTAFLRFTTVSKTPIQIRHVLFYKAERH